MWRKIIAQFQSPLIYLLLVAVAISVLAWLAEGAAGLPIDAIVIAAVILFNGILGFVQENKAEDAVAALQSMTAASSTVLRDGELCTVPSADIVRGDILVLGEGDSVGADARLFEATALRISEASLTGESEAVIKNVAALSAPAPLGDRTGMVYKGTAVRAAAPLTAVMLDDPAVRQSYPFDQAKAKALLDEAGWQPGADGIRQKGGQRLELVLNAIEYGGSADPTAQLIQASLRDVGIDDKFMKELADGLPAGSSALFVLVRKATPDRVLEEIKGTGGKILRTSLTHEDEAKLQAALSAAKQ